MYVDGKMLSVTKYRIPFLLEQAHDLYKGARIYGHLQPCNGLIPNCSVCLLATEFEILEVGISCQEQ